MVNVVEKSEVHLIQRGELANSAHDLAVSE